MGCEEKTDLRENMPGRDLSSALFRGRPRCPGGGETPLHRVTSDERASIRAPGFTRPAFTVRRGRLDCVGLACRLPQRDCSGFSPDSMTRSWLVGPRHAGMGPMRQAQSVAAAGYAQALALEAKWRMRFGLPALQGCPNAFRLIVLRACRKVWRTNAGADWHSCWHAA